MKLRIFICLLLAVTILPACNRAKPSRTVGLNEIFTLKKDEVVNIVGTEINLKMLETSPADDPRVEGGTINMCTVEVTFRGDKEEQIIEQGNFISYDQFNVKLEKANLAPSPENTSCVFYVAKTLG